MLKRLAADSVYFEAGRNYLNFIERADALNGLLYHYDLRDEALDVFRDRDPRGLNEYERAAVLRMYTYIRDNFLGGVGTDEAIRISGFSELQLCEAGVLEKDIVEADKLTAAKTENAVKWLHKHMPWLYSRGWLKITGYEPASNTVRFDTVNNAAITGRFRASLNEDSVYLSEEAVCAS